MSKENPKVENQMTLTTQPFLHDFKISIQKYLNELPNVGPIYNIDAISKMLDDDGGDEDDDASAPAVPWYNQGGSTSTGTSQNTKSTGPVGNVVQQQISGGSPNYNLPNNSWPFSTKQSTTNLLPLSTSKLKTSVRYIIFKKDGTSLVLEERSQITPQEMIGITKFLSVVTSVLHGSFVKYNINISWSDLVTSLGISSHFSPGLTRADYTNVDSDVLDIMLTDG